MTSGTVHEKERTKEKVAIYLGRLGDFGLGNPEGIPSSLAEATPEELQAYAQELLEQLADPTDQTAFHCIDGRVYFQNADGSQPERRLRHVSGTESNLAISLNGDSPVTRTIDPESPIEDQAAAIDDHMAQTTGVEASAHLGGCGGAGGEIDDQKAINAKPAIMKVVGALMTMPVIRNNLVQGHEKDFTGQTEVYSDTLGARVTDRAGQTAEYLRAKGWDGASIVDSATKRHPRGVADLETDHDKFHGHKEPAIGIIIGKKTLPIDTPVFAWNVEASKKVAEGLVGNGGAEGYAQLLVADFAKHIATCDRLPSDKTPIFILADY